MSQSSPLISLALYAFTLPVLAAQPTYTPGDARQFVATYCAACHQGNSPAAGLNLPALLTAEQPAPNRELWSRIALRVRNSEMPPRGAPAPPLDARERFAAWIDEHAKSAACPPSASPARTPMRRLNRSEYTATIRDLLDIHLDAGHALPADGAGGEGFDNAAETLFLSPLHAEKYLEAARLATETLSRDATAREKLLIAKPGEGLSG